MPFQPDSALTAIVLGFSLVPAVLILASLVVPVPLLPRLLDVASSRSSSGERATDTTKGTRMNDVLARLREMQAGDVPVTGGRTLAYVYDSGLEDADRIGREAVAAYAGSNGLDPTAFPSLLTMENELVGVAADLLDAPDTDRRHRHLAAAPSRCCSPCRAPATPGRTSSARGWCCR